MSQAQSPFSNIYSKLSLILAVPSETYGGMLSAVDTMVQRCDSLCQLCNYGDDEQPGPAKENQ